MKRRTYDEAISELLMVDEFIADCIINGIEGCELAFARKLTEDEKMIAFSMYLSGSIMEQGMQHEEENKYQKICLN